MALLLSDLGVTKTHSRPYVSNDNPYSESVQDDEVLPQFPSRIGSAEDGRLFCGCFFGYYNVVEAPTLGIGLMTPADVHYGRAEQLSDARREILLDAQRAHPERFVRGTPATSRFASAGLDQPAAGKNDAPGCCTSPSRGDVHTWGTPFFCFTQRDLDRCGRRSPRPHESPHHNRGSLPMQLASVSKLLTRSALSPDGAPVRCPPLTESPFAGDVLRSLSKKKMYGSPNSNPSPELGADKENHTSWERYYQVSDCSSSLRNDWYSGI